jgi:hypothetical protein
MAYQPYLHCTLLHPDPSLVPRAITPPVDRVLLTSLYVSTIVHLWGNVGVAKGARCAGQVWCQFRRTFTTKVGELRNLLCLVNYRIEKNYS